MVQSSKGRIDWGYNDLKDLAQLGRAIISEFLGTAILVWLATATCAQFRGNGETVHVSLTVGFTVATVIQTLAHVGGCHINPAVTLGFVIMGKTSALRAILYVIVQLAGAVAGTEIYKITTPENLRGIGLCSNRVNTAAGVTAEQALVVEIVLTFCLVLVILAVSDKNRRPHHGGTGPFIEGLTVCAAFLMGLRYSGVSLNPARSFGPAILSNYWEHHWIYWVGPLSGAAIAGYMYRNWFKAPKPQKEQNANT
uniref:Aquaporin n=1 Tax=Homalodisca liturata TaxID=320908 RepID=A0A1B6JA27_9HEMI